MRSALLCVLMALVTSAAAGEQWSHVGMETEPGLPGNEVQFLTSTDGEVWVGTLTGIARVRKGKYTPVKGEDGEPLKINAWCVLERGNDRFWIGHGNGAVFVDGVKTTHALGGQTVAPIIEVRPGVLWALGKNRGSERNALFVHAGEEWKSIEEAAKFRIVDLFQAADGKVWVTLDGNGVLEVDPEAGLAAGTHHLEGLNVTTVAQAGREFIWCGLWGRGVASWDGVAWTHHLSAKEKSAILAICEDSGNNIWVATSANGLWRKPVNKETWVNHLKDEGGINLLATSSDGRVWVSSQMQGGLRYWDGETWVVSLDNPLPIRCLIETPDRTLWAGGVLDGVYSKKME